MKAAYVASTNTPLHFGGTSISKDAEGRVSLTDLWKAAGAQHKKDPGTWKAQKNNKGFIAHIQNSQKSDGFNVIASYSGRYGGTFAVLQIAIEYARCLSPVIAFDLNALLFAAMPQDSILAALAASARNASLYEPAKVESKTYLMVDERSGLVKIGRSNNPTAREKTLQGEAPTISLLAIAPLDIEEALHSQYGEHRVRGEWFKLSKSEVLNIIETHKFQRHAA